MCEVVPHYSFVCIFLLINTVEHLVMCLVAIRMPSLEKCLFRSPAHFSVGLVFFVVVVVVFFVIVVELYELFAYFGD